LGRLADFSPKLRWHAEDIGFLQGDHQIDIALDAATSLGNFPCIPLPLPPHFIRIFCLHDFLPEDDVGGSLRTHDSYFGCRPCKYKIGAQVA
jgi:hypothetical protein